MRIELGEIENVLRSHSHVREAAVVAHGDDAASKRLAAFYLSDEQGLTGDDLAAFLSQKLPAYMIPDRWERLDSFPLNRHHKIDRLHLLGLIGSAGAREFLPPTNDIEEAVADIWADCLGLERVGLGESFFCLGGHSLLATKVVWQIQEKLKCPIAVKDLFENPTVDKLSKCIELREQQKGRAAKAAQLLKKIKTLTPEQIRQQLSS